MVGPLTGRLAWAPMMATGYTIAGLLIGGTLLLAGGILAALWFAVSSARPELLERPRPRNERPNAIKWLLRSHPEGGRAARLALGPVADREMERDLARHGEERDEGGAGARLDERQRQLPGWAGGNRRVNHFDVRGDRPCRSRRTSLQTRSRSGRLVTALSGGRDGPPTVLVVGAGSRDVTTADSRGWRASIWPASIF